MGRLAAEYTPRFLRDYKRLQRQRRDMSDLHEVFALVMENTPEALDELRRRHRMHTLSGAWKGSSECHVCNAGD